MWFSFKRKNRTKKQTTPNKSEVWPLLKWKYSKCSSGLRLCIRCSAGVLLTPLLSWQVELCLLQDGFWGWEPPFTSWEMKNLIQTSYLQAVRKLIKTSGALEWACSMQAHICYQQQKDLDWFFFFFFGLALVIMTHQRFVSLLKVTFLFPSLLFLFNSTFWVELHSARMCGSILRKVFI